MCRQRLWRRSRVRKRPLAASLRCCGVVDGCARASRRVEAPSRTPESTSKGESSPCNSRFHEGRRAHDAVPDAKTRASGREKACRSHLERAFSARCVRNAIQAMADRRNRGSGSVFQERCRGFFHMVTIAGRSKGRDVHGRAPDRCPLASSSSSAQLRCLVFLGRKGVPVFPVTFSISD